MKTIYFANGFLIATLYSMIIDLLHDKNTKEALKEKREARHNKEYF